MAIADSCRNYPTLIDTDPPVILYRVTTAMGAHAPYLPDAAQHALHAGSAATRQGS